jgi:hypothetical protein
LNTLVSILEALARDTWERLNDARALSVRFGEETITDLLLLDIQRRVDYLILMTGWGYQGTTRPNCPQKGKPVRNA